MGLPKPIETIETQSLVVGTGISGLFTALKLSEHGLNVVLITKTSLEENNSRYAQGGIAAVLPENPDDSLELHLQDTIRAGAGLCNEAASRSILHEGYAAIADLLDYGVPFDRKPNQELALTREAAHSVARIIHAGGDATGYSVEMTLIGRVRQHPRIQVMEYGRVVELLVEEHRCFGCRIIHEEREIIIQAPHIVLATGGIGRLYSHTTNPAIATGDGIALACEAGAEIQNMEFIQFHPTAFYAEGELHFLVSEALRGEGGVLLNRSGERFALNYHPDGELAPRDVVTRAIFAEMQADAAPHVYLDISHLPTAQIENRFPTILENCLRFGVDIRTDRIPVAPAAHYLMGGITVDDSGQTTLPGLYAVGETAYTGLHGANRLASNSLLECVVLARRAARMIAQNLERKGSQSPEVPVYPKTYRFETPEAVLAKLDRLHTLMWDRVGIVRNGDGLAEALQAIEDMLATTRSNGWDQVIPHGRELKNQLVVARLITEAALARRESRGAHYREDYPETPAGPAHSSLALSCRSR